MPDTKLELSEHEFYFLPSRTSATAPAMRGKAVICGK